MKKSVFLIPFLSLAMMACAQTPQTPTEPMAETSIDYECEYTKEDSALVVRLLKEAKTNRGAENRMMYFGKKFLGLPYVGHTLELGDKEHLIVISPDEGALERAIYFASVLGVDTGMFYKRRDYSTIVNGKNPIVAHEFLGDNVDGKDIIVIDDMISSGGSMLDTAKHLKEMNARRVFVCCTFGLFTEGLKAFDEAFEKGYFDKIVCTDLTYLPPELFTRPYFIEADMSKFIASIIDFMNHDISMSNVLATTEKIHSILDAYNARENVEIDFNYS